MAGLAVGTEYEGEDFNIAKAKFYLI